MPDTFLVKELKTSDYSSMFPENGVFPRTTIGDPSAMKAEFGDEDNDSRKLSP